MNLKVLLLVSSSGYLNLIIIEGANDNVIQKRPTHSHEMFRPCGKKMDSL